MEIIRKVNWGQNIIIAVLVVILSYLVFHVVKAGLVSSFSDQLSTQVIATAANHTISFTTGSNFGPGEILELYFESDFDLSRVDYTDIDFMDDSVDLNLGASPGTGSGSNIGVAVSGQTISFTQNDTDIVLAGSKITIAIGLNADYQVTGDKQIYNPTIAGSYNISLAGDFGDLGVLAVQIVTSDSVVLEAEIAPELSFALRNSDDTATFNECNLGSITYFGISQCQYRLAAQTNAVRGFEIYVKVDGNLRNSYDEIANISENNLVIQGEEGHGIGVQAGAGISEQGDFTDDDTPLSTSDQLLIKTDSVYNYIQGNLASSSLITHKASVSPETEAGVYSQVIYYTILANY